MNSRRQLTVAERISDFIVNGVERLLSFDLFAWVPRTSVPPVYAHIEHTVSNTSRVPSEQRSMVLYNSRFAESLAQELGLGEEVYDLRKAVWINSSCWSAEESDSVRGRIQRGEAVDFDLLTWGSLESDDMLVVYYVEVADRKCVCAIYDPYDFYFTNQMMWAVEVNGHEQLLSTQKKVMYPP